MDFSNLLVLLIGAFLIFLPPFGMTAIKKDIKSGKMFEMDSKIYKCIEIVE